MNRERREALGIPIHDDPREHVFSDGYCCCGAEDPDDSRTVASRPPKLAPGTGSLWSRPADSRKPRRDLDQIEGNREEYFG